MKKIIISSLLLLPTLTFGATLFSQSIYLSPGWNSISTPRLLDSHTFSLPETSDNFDIYILNPQSPSFWSTMADMDQTEFTPMYGYFVNNKSTTTQTLTFNYLASTTPNQRLFERVFSTTGWYSVGVANGTYAKKIADNVTDTNNVSACLDSFTSSIQSIIDFTSQLFPTSPNSVAVGDQWQQAISNNLDTLNDLRNGKAYAVYVDTASSTYIGFQNNDNELENSILSLAKNSGVADVVALPNTTDIKVGSYAVIASSTEDIRVTELVVGFYGDILLSSMTNFYVKVGEAIVSSPSAILSSNTIPVDITISAGDYKIIEIYSDFGSNSGSASTTLSMSGYGVYSSSSILSSTNISSTAVGQNIIVNLETLATPTKAGSSPAAQLVVGETTSTIVNYNFVSTSTTSVISEMYFDVTGPITSITIGGNPFSIVSGSSIANGLNISIPVGEAGTNVAVSATYSTIGLAGEASLQNALVTLTGYKYTSGNSTTTSTSSVSSNTMIVVASKPTVGVQNSTDSGSGFKTFAKVTVLADAKGEVKVLNLPIEIITTSGASIDSGMSVYVGGSSEIISGDFVVGANSTATGTISFSGDGYSVAPGTSVTFLLKGNLTGNSGDSILTRLGNKDLFIWQDVNGNATTSGSYIYNYPTSDSVFNY